MPIRARGCSAWSRRAGAGAVLLLTTMPGLWAADRLLAESLLAGSAGWQLASAGFVSAVLVSATFLSAAFVRAVLLPALLHRVLGRMTDGHALGGARIALTTSSVALTKVVVPPVALWSAVRLGAALGLPVGLVGFSRTLAAAVVITTVRFVVLLAVPALLVLVFGHTRAAAGTVLGLALPPAGVWLAVVALDGVAVEPGLTVSRALTMIVFIALFTVASIRSEFAQVGYGWTGLRLPVAAVVAAHVVLDALKLWAFSWLSTFTAVTVSVTGFRTFLSAALLTTASTFLGQWISTRAAAARGQSRAVLLRTGEAGR